MGALEAWLKELRRHHKPSSRKQAGWHGGGCCGSAEKPAGGEAGGYRGATYAGWRGGGFSAGDYGQTRWGIWRSSYEWCKIE